MRIKKVLFVFLMVLPVLASLAALQFMPDQIPAHYGVDGQVTRWGSKYETLIFPAIILLFGGIMALVTRVAARREPQGSNENACLLASVGGLMVFNVMNGYFLYTSLKGVENLSDAPVDVYQLVFGILGVLLILVGNIMPKARRNSLFGLRTTWSMQNDTVWKKSQRFGGISLMVTGAAMVVISLLTSGFLCFLLSVAVLLVPLPVDIYYTYRAAKQCGEE